MTGTKIELQRNHRSERVRGDDNNPAQSRDRAALQSIWNQDNHDHAVMEHFTLVWTSFKLQFPSHNVSKLLYSSEAKLSLRLVWMRSCLLQQQPKWEKKMTRHAKPWTHVSDLLSSQASCPRVPTAVTGQKQQSAHTSVTPPTWQTLTHLCDTRTNRFGREVITHVIKYLLLFLLRHRWWIENESLLTSDTWTLMAAWDVLVGSVCF